MMPESLDLKTYGDIDRIGNEFSRFTRIETFQNLERTGVLRNENGKNPLYLLEGYLGEGHPIKQWALKRQREYPTKDDEDKDPGARAAWGRERERYFSEICLLAHCRALPQVPTLAAFGEYEGHVSYLMEYLPGSSLEASLKKELPRVEIACQTARALHEIHQKGVIHRDIKPENIIISPGGERVKIIDFGISLKRGTGEKLPHGVVIGTAHYLPPERARGSRGDVLSDVYSLGATLYQLFSGQTPFEGDNIAILQKHLSEEPTPLSNVPTRLNWIILKALRKNPQNRQKSAEELANDLASFL